MGKVAAEKRNLLGMKSVYKVMNLPSDGMDLVRRVLDGEKAAFRGIVEQHERLVRHVVYRLVLDSDDRQDLCQEVFVRVYQGLPSFEGKARLSTWIASIAHNSCLHFLNKKRAFRYTDIYGEDSGIDNEPSQLPSPAEETDYRKQSLMLCEEIDRLPVRYGLILSLYHLQDMSYNEIGDILSMPDGTVKNYLFRARRLLKKRLQIIYESEEICA